MTPTEHAYWTLCFAVAQQGYLLWLERMTAPMPLPAAQAPAAPVRQRPKLTVVR